MKLPRRLMVLAFICYMTQAYAMPDKIYPQDEVANVTSGSALSEDAAGDLLLQAISLLGVAYRFGGSSPSTGLDCSGFIQYIFKQSLKMNLPRTASQMARVGLSIERKELVPGDLVFFNTRGFIFSHVGIYMGNDKFIHAPRTGKKIEVSNLSKTYWQRRYNGARRVANASSVSENNDEEITLPERAFNDGAVIAVGRTRCISRAAGRPCRQVKTYSNSRKNFYRLNRTRKPAKKVTKKTVVRLVQ